MALQQEMNIHKASYLLALEFRGIRARGRARLDAPQRRESSARKLTFSTGPVDLAHSIGDRVYGNPTLCERTSLYIPTLRSVAMLQLLSDSGVAEYYAQYGG